jgi:hypothetical protein
MKIMNVITLTNVKFHLMKNSICGRSDVIVPAALILTTGETPNNQKITEKGTSC